MISGGSLFPFGDLRADLTADGSDPPFQVADAGFARVLVDDGLQRVLGQADLVRAQAILADLPGDQVSFGDGDLFALGVTGKLDDLHPVQQGRGNGLIGIRRGNEEDL